MHVVRLVDDRGKDFAIPPYSSFLIEKTKKVLGRVTTIPEKVYPDLARSYYHLLKELGDQANVCEHLENGDIHRLEMEFTLIDAVPRCPYFIIQDKTDNEIWEKYLEILDMDRSTLEKYKERERIFNRIRRDFYERIVNYPIRNMRSDEVIPVNVEDGLYSPETGLFIDRARENYDFL